MNFISAATSGCAPFQPCHPRVFTGAGGSHQSALSPPNTAHAWPTECGTTDITAATTPSGLARRFAEHFPRIVASGKGSDWLYVGWYVEMLHLTYPDQRPYALADYEVPDEYIPTTTSGGRELDVRIRLPPPGEDRPTKDNE